MNRVWYSDIKKVIDDKVQLSQEESALLADRIDSLSIDEMRGLIKGLEEIIRKHNELDKAMVDCHRDNVQADQEEEEPRCECCNGSINSPGLCSTCANIEDNDNNAFDRENDR